ncbi:major facilitator superfamily transporter [Pyrenophora seminiperda CCB06]|uniref:Major facilitator superfamily transporter n=1 Tax=Pyrenophora seminiperda CCB06 TaxID=1302712 RepID=A0A3M7MJD8_9PLEO|nr:major facilitator superfamily transporter [Pyrenophora seminiperda CCB06]
MARKSLTIPHLIRGLAEGLHMGGDFSTLLGATGLVASEHPFTGTFNLDDLDMHNWPTEHDVSVSRPDANLGGDYISFNETVWNSYISFFDGKPTMDVVTTAHARYARLQDSKKNNPKLVFGPKEEVLSLAENALILMTMGGNMDWVKCFIEEEKLPFDQGWRPPGEKITLISLGRKSVEILKHSPDLAPELKGVTIRRMADMARLSAPASDSKRRASYKSSDGNVRQSAALEAVGSRPRHAQRRPTKETSYDLSNHAKAYLEGGQYVSGYDFLYSLLAAGTSISTPAQPYMGRLAPPAYIAFASSLVADPKFTTKSRSRDAHKGPDAALRYLQCICTTIDGPAYPTIREAFTFPEERNRRRAPGRAAAVQSPVDSSDIERIVGEAANEKSLWYRADDFWHIVGWAFNCSIAHKKRWSRWKLWLSNILDFIEADWEVCVKQGKTDEGIDELVLQESLLWYYIVGEESAPTNRTRRRRIVKAILGTATPDSLKEYPEIWAKETAEPKKKNDDEPIGEVDFETGKTADYDVDEDMQDAPDGVEEDAQESPLHDDQVWDLHDAVEHLGGHDAIQLRYRLMTLLTQVAQALPKQFTSLFDLCDNILEEFNSLPTIIFQTLLSTMKLPSTVQMAFIANLFHPLIAGKSPNFFLVKPTQEHFESKLLLLKASTQSFAANAKISLILEQMVLHMMSQDALLPTPALRNAMETGIHSRATVQGLKRGNANEEQQAKVLMQMCAARLLCLLEVLEMTKAVQQSKPTKRRTRAIKEAALMSFASASSLSPAPDSD